MAGIPTSPAARRRVPRLSHGVDHDGDAEGLGQLERARVRQVGAHLRNVRAVERAGVQIHQRFAVHDHLIEEGARDPRGGASVRPAGKVAIQVAAVRQVARRLAEAVQVDDRHADQHAAELAGVEILQDPAHHLDAVQLVAVDPGREAEGGARLDTAGHAHRNRDGAAGEGLARHPGEQPLLPRRDRLAQHLDGLPLCARGGCDRAEQHGEQRAPKASLPTPNGPRSPPICAVAARSSCECSRAGLRVGPFQVANDVRGFEHRRAGIGVDQPGHHHLARTLRRRRRRFGLPLPTLCSR